MAFPLKHDFCERSLALIRGRLWNKVARICSYWASGTGIELVKPETPTPESPIVIGLNPVEAAPAIAHEFDTQGLWRDNPGGGVKKELASGYERNASASTNEKTDKWERGEKDEDGKRRGFRLQVMCRMLEDGLDGCVYWRTLVFDGNGRCVGVEAENDDFGQIVTRVDRET